MNAPLEKPRSVDVEIERVIAAAHDALTDEMVSRLASTASDAIDLMDQVNRAGLSRAIPALAEMVNNGDLNRLVKLARVYGSAEDALTDEMVGRLTETVGNGLSLLDRASRGGAEHVIKMLEGLQESGALERIATRLPQLADRLTQLEQQRRSSRSRGMTTLPSHAASVLAAPRR